MILVLLFATVLIAAWIYLLFAVKDEDWLKAARGRLLNNRIQIEKLKKEDMQIQEKLQKYHGVSRKFMKIFLDKDIPKKIAKLREENRQIQNGNMKSVGIMDMPGYAVLRRFKGINSSGIYRKIRSTYFELYGKKYPDLLTQNLMAKLFSYPLIGVGASLALGAIVMIAGEQTAGIGIMTIGTVLILVLVYAMYDEVADLVNKRRDAIARQFPNVVSKLALLVTAGMIMDRAWRETAESGEGEIYQEMRRTADELDNLVSPEAAYSAFIDRCNTKETTKLASAIMQNQSKGNSEIAILLKQMAAEAWNERRNLAKRDSENANSKLMIPTMLLFGSVMLMLMVPVVMSFSSM